MKDIIKALQAKVVRNNVAIAVDLDSKANVVIVSGRDAYRNIAKIEHDIKAMAKDYVIDKAYFDDVCKAWVIAYHAKKENLSHKAMKLANQIKSAYSSFAAALKAAYSVLRSETAKQTILKGLASACHAFAKLGLDKQSDNAFNAYMTLLVL